MEHSKPRTIPAPCVLKAKIRLIINVNQRRFGCTHMRVYTEQKARTCERTNGVLSLSIMAQTLHLLFVVLFLQCFVARHEWRQ